MKIFWYKVRILFRMDGSMKEFKVMFLVIIFVTISILIFLYTFYYEENLDTIQKIFSIIGSFSLGIALVSYLYKKKLDETLTAINQINFFREKIIPEWTNLIEQIKNKDKSFWFSRINLTNYKTVNDIKDIRNNFSRNFDNQLSIFFKNSIDIQQDDNILNYYIKLLNIMEEFSIRVYHFKTVQHQVLVSVYAPFIEIIEKNAVALIFIRDIINSNGTYSNTLSLYKSWANKVKKINYVNNLEKYGFITKNQKEEIFKKQRKQSNA